MFGWGFGRDPRWSDEFERLRRGMDDLMGAAAGGTRPFAAPIWREACLFPLLNVRRVNDNFLVTAELPGMNIEDLEIKVEGDTLTLKGERKPPEEAAGASHHRRERAVGAFQRSLTLPAGVEGDQVKATYKNGVLTVTLPLAKAALPKPIQITAE